MLNVFSMLIPVLAFFVFAALFILIKCRHKIRKLLLLTVLMVAIAVASPFIGIGIGRIFNGTNDEPDNPGEHTHSYTPEVTELPDCTTSGTRILTCSCGHSVTETIPPAGHLYWFNKNSTHHWQECACGDITEEEPHSYSLQGKNDNTHWSECVCEEKTGITPHEYSLEKRDSTHHWSECSCGAKTDSIAHSYENRSNETHHWTECSCGAKKAEEEHSFIEGVCKCGRKTVTEGLAYTLSQDETYYILDGMGTATDTDVVIPSMYNGLPVKIIGRAAFYNCTAIKSVVIPESVEEIDSSFYGCSGLTSIVIPNSVTTIGASSFAGCSSLESITIPFVGNTKDGTSNTHFGYIFGAGTGKNNSYSVPSTLKTVIITGGNSIGNEAFYGCADITDITLPNSLTSIGSDAFYGCSGLTDIILPDGVYSIGDNAFESCTALETLIIPESVVKIGAYLTLFCNNLQYNKYGELTYLGSKTNPYFALLKCPEREVESVEIHEGTKIIADDAFRNCVLTSVTIPDGVISIGNSAFEGCSNLMSISIPDTVEYIGGNIVYGCENLQYNVFDNAKYLGNEKNRYLILADAVNKDIASCEINEKTKFIADGAFAECKNIEHITIPNSVYMIGSAAFNECSNIKSIEMGNNIYEIGFMAFYNCSSLERITLSANLTSLGTHAFSDCTSLASVTIYSGITNIGEYTFGHCSSLMEINFEGSEEQWNLIDKDYNWDVYSGDYTIHCTDGDIVKD